MNLTLRRDEFTADCTIGNLLVDDAYFSYSLELPDVDGKPGSCIPQGRYPVVFSPSYKFSLSTDDWVLGYSAMMPHIVSIPNRSEIMFHWGNSAHDTNGCVLLGYDHPSQDFIGSSRKAFGDFWLKIETPARSRNCWVNVLGGARGLPDQAPGLETDITT